MIRNGQLLEFSYQSRPKSGFRISDHTAFQLIVDPVCRQMDAQKPQPDSHINKNCPAPGFSSLDHPIDYICDQKRGKEGRGMFQQEKESGEKKFVILSPVEFQKHPYRVLPMLLITGCKAALHLLIPVHFTAPPSPLPEGCCMALPMPEGPLQGIRPS